MNFFSLNFWLDSRPGLLIPAYYNTLIGVIVLFVILATIIFFLKKKGGFYLKLLERFFNFFTTNAFIGLVLWFFNSELIPFFSSRFWYFLWAIGMIVWSVFIFKYSKSLPVKRKEIEEKKAFNKYIP